MLRHSVDAVEVVPGLWIGSAPSARQAQQLRSAGVDAVVDLRAERDDDAVEWPRDVTVCFAPMEDHGTPSPEQLRDAASIVVDLMAAGCTVLVHCHAGVERAPTVACAALVLQGWPSERAYQSVVQARPAALPTDGQLSALRSLAAASRHAQN